jgi:hypothetical protein
MTKYANTAMPMRIQARPGSPAETLYYQRSVLPGGAWPRPKAIAPGINPAPLEDLMFHGGKVVPQMEFQNIYLGGNTSWLDSDVNAIDLSIQRAMRHKRLNNVMVQYFPGSTLVCDMRPSFVLDAGPPTQLDEPDVQAQVVAMFDGGLLKKTSLSTCIFNLVLPRGSVLKLGGSSSLNGLGGYHGSVHIKRNGKAITLYYSANVFSELRPNGGASGRENGIVVFDKPWKNVVGTLYHELNEFRTDADVNDAIEKRNNDFLGWTSRSGKEVGDQPIFRAGEAGDLRLVFKEVLDSPRKTRVPVQFMYSNAVHGAEGPIAKAHA